MGKVYIVGAGPGSLELLTLKGKRAIEEAQCIIYDRLVNPQILNLAKEDCELIYLGKGNTEGGLIQDEINKTLVKKSKEGKIVTRLKGGDPFVFGRGGEEIYALKEAGISFEVVSGITSSISVPAYGGIPVTHRKIARSFHVFTGHLAKGGKWHNFEVIAKLEGTLVFLMGVKNLGRIVGDLIKNGKNPKTPIAIIEKGSTTNQRIITGELSTILEKAEKKEIKPPAIIIIGEVVNLRKDFKWFEKQPLIGRKVIVTRDIKKGYEFIEEIEKLGGAGIAEPFIDISTNKNIKEIDLEKVGTLLFNSQNGVKQFFNRIKDLRVLGDIKVGVVGIKTYEEIKKYKIIPDFIPEIYSGKELAKEAIAHTPKGKRIMFITSNVSPLDEEKLKDEFNREFKVVRLFDTISLEKDSLRREDYEDGIITFFSGSGVEGFVKSMKKSGINLGKNLKVASIGKMTTKTLEENNIKVDIEAKKSTAEGLLEAIVEYCNGKKEEGKDV